MASLYEQRNLSMTPEQWRSLEAIAVDTGSRSTRGPDAYQPSWRKLIQRIADGEITIAEKEPYKMPDGLDRAIEQLSPELEPA